MCMRRMQITSAVFILQIRSVLIRRAVAEAAVVIEQSVGSAQQLLQICQCLARGTRVIELLAE